MLLASIKHLSSTERAIAKILCGDFNDVVDSPAVRTLLDSDEDFQDVFAECHPNDPGFTYACRNQYVDPSWTADERVDYIFATRDLVPQVCSVAFDGSNGFDFVSDHLAFEAGAFSFCAETTPSSGFQSPEVEIRQLLLTSLLLRYVPPSSAMNEIIEFRDIDPEPMMECDDGS